MPGFYLPTEEEFDHTTDDFIQHVLSKERRYKHFDLPLSSTDRAIAIDFPTQTTAHRFLPLLGFTSVTRRYIRNATGGRHIKVKERPIRYAGHGDSAYLHAYASHLTPYYERGLVKDGTSTSVLAYRKGGGTNIHHAKSLFDEIVERGDCSVFAMDISGFFDSLNHELLRDELAELLGTTRLEGHHGTVWKNVTKYAWVETEDLDELLGKKRNGQGRICSHSDFVRHVQGRKDGLIQKHDLPYGIPQGTPVSGLYANIYLRSFDREMNAYCNKHGGSYRRYSDDIAVALPLGAKVRHVAGVVEKLLADYELAMSSDKTDTANFQSGRLISQTPIQYLGFTFDGQITLIRPSSIDAYRLKMRRGIHAKLVAAKMQNIPLPRFSNEKR